jgi:hypothetical protein
LNYFLTDHLGSVVAVTDETGALLSEQRYLPFGHVRSDVGSVTETDFVYTKQRDLDGQARKESVPPQIIGTRKSKNEKQND